MALTTLERREFLKESISLLEFELENTEIPLFIQKIKERQLKAAKKRLKEINK